MAADVSAVGFFLPIFAFLLVFVVTYAIITKTKVLGDNKGVTLLIAFILASFFIVQVSLVDFIQFTSSWFAVAMVMLFFLTIIIAFLPGDSSKIFEGKKWFGWVIFVCAVLFFIFSAGYVFDSAINWDFLRNLVNKDWFGMILLFGIAAIVAGRLAKDSGSKK